MRPEMIRSLRGGQGDPEIDFPERTPQEGKALDEQIDLLRLSRDQLLKMFREGDLLGPLLYGEAGYDAQVQGLTGKNKEEHDRLKAELEALSERIHGLPRDSPERKELEERYGKLNTRIWGILDNAWQITGVTKKNDPHAPLRQQIERGWLDRVLAAQRGELPVNPALLRDLRESEQQMEETLRRQLGPGWSASSAGIEGLTKFGESKNIQLDQARRGDMTMAEALSLGRKQESEALRDNSLRRLLGIGQRNLPGIGGLFEASKGYSAPLAYMLGERQGQFGADAIQFQYDADSPFTWRNLFRSFQSDARSFGGMAGGAAMSTVRVKKDIEPVDKQGATALQKLRDTPIFRYRYTWESPERERHVGPLLELSPKEIRASDTHISLLDYIGLTPTRICSGTFHSMNWSARSF